jgi:hypothetical protein
MAQLQDPGLAGMGISQQLHHHHSGGGWPGPQGQAGPGFRDTFKPASWSRTQRDKVGRCAPSLG